MFSELGTGQQSFGLMQTMSYISTPPLAPAKFSFFAITPLIVARAAGGGSRLPRRRQILKTGTDP